MTQQMFKKSEFLGRKGDILPLHRDLVAVKVHGQLAVLVGGLAFLAAAIRAELGTAPTTNSTQPATRPATTQP